ncbi:hypothetical protein, partial [Streptomyces sp. URMC 124]|uniref:hypothetical protein n=1 Tax=Streptomyces sp. URMC 124 TaxID=3423405 RepID=UPI003F1DA9CD
RLLLARQRVVILDEATAHLDSTSEAARPRREALLVGLPDGQGSTLDGGGHGVRGARVEDAGDDVVRVEFVFGDDVGEGAGGG